MHRISPVALVALVVVAAVARGDSRAVRGGDPRALPGWPLYDRACSPCHGTRGDGHGPAAPYSRGEPRDFTHGAYEWRSTASGQPPTDDDLRDVIRFGARGTSMPAFGDTLSAADIDRLVDVAKAFDAGTFATPGKPIALGPARRPDAARGAYLWTQLGCARCHGDSGRGDGPAAKQLVEKPYDLVAEPLKRPRASDDIETRRRAAAMSIATGMAGTPMPGYAGQVADADLWALADHVVALGAAAKPPRTVIDDEALERDRAHPIEVGAWPGTGDDAALFGTAIAPQGAPPSQLAPAQASLRELQCARCHAKQAREWRPSVHGGAASPGFRAQVAAHGTSSDRCDRCHAPLAEQRVGGDADLRNEGVTCAACHLRAWVRHGPPRLPSSTLVASPSYPRVERAIYERADFCMPCHQLPPRTAIEGKPLLDTYREWLEGPYFRRGIQCQHCHMPDREHAWLGVHDRDTFRQAIRLDASAHRERGKVTVLAELANVGAGHHVPTTVTPAAWLRVELVDARGAPIAGARAEQRIGRDVWNDADGWHERSDTRIAPGASIALARAWIGGRTADATAARITVEVHPDDYYERLYARQLAGQLPAATRTLYEQALARATASHYVAEQRDVAIAASSPQR